MTIRAVFERGVFRPIEQVNLPDPCDVEIEICQIKAEVKVPDLDEVYAILGRRHQSGQHDLAERHNEHQP